MKNIQISFFSALSLLSTAALAGVFFQLDASLSNGAHLAQWAKNQNSCVYSMLHSKYPSKHISIERVNIATAVRYCNGGR